ncbi:MAG: hypothetical protein M5U19_05430 [Microthrixaceae bacterium]|nr:hypothetical protein [Microthrixaceae bacterium]
MNDLPIPLGSPPRSTRCHEHLATTVLQALSSGFGVQRSQHGGVGWARLAHAHDVRCCRAIEGSQRYRH